jgi:inorganic pyrophosphatase
MRLPAALGVTVLLVGACLPTGRAVPLAPALCGVSLQPLEAPREVIALIEIPRGGTTKYEYDASSGRLVADRELPDSLGYPAAYGTFPCTLAGDGDPLDVLVLTPEPLDTASLIRVRPIGVLQMYDRGAADDKVIAVPLTSSLKRVPLADQQAIARFFAIYKGPGADIQIGPWLNAKAAMEILRDAVAAATPP